MILATPYPQGKEGKRARGTLRKAFDRYLGDVTRTVRKMGKNFGPDYEAVLGTLRDGKAQETIHKALQEVATSIEYLGEVVEPRPEVVVQVCPHSPPTG